MRARCECKPQSPVPERDLATREQRTPEGGAHGGGRGQQDNEAVRVCRVGRDWCASGTVVSSVPALGNEAEQAAQQLGRQADEDDVGQGGRVVVRGGHGS